MEATSSKSKKIRKGDKVVAIAGNYRGLTGTVLSCTDKGVIVQGLNVRKKHVKPTQENQKGGIVEMEKPIHVSNLKVTAPSGEGVKLKVRKNSNGERELFYRVNSEEVVHRSMKKS